MEKIKDGRPTKLTPELQLKICETIRAGNYIETAAAYVGVNKSTIYEWMKRGAREKKGIHHDFSNAVEKALAESEMRDVLIIGKAATENWQAAAWRLERKFSERWGRKDTIKAEHSGKVTNSHEFHIEQTITEDPESVQLLKQLWKRQSAVNAPMGDSSEV